MELSIRKISGFIISLALLNCVLANAQDTIRYPVNAMKGVRIGFDVSKFAMPLIYKGNPLGIEVTADVHVKDNFFATAEAGWVKLELQMPDFRYWSSGYFGKLGTDYNLLKSRRPFNNDIVYGGLRYAFSTFSHQADQINMQGYFWPNASGLNFPKYTMQAHWLELLLGVKAEVLKNLYVSLTFRFKFIVSAPKDNYSKPYLIPGYGHGNENFAIGLNYYISYNIHF